MIDRAHDQLVEVFKYVPKRLGLPAPPGLHARQLRLAAEQVLRDLRQESHKRRVLKHARTERVDDGDRAGPCHLKQPGNAELRISPELERIRVPVIDTAQDHVDRLKLADRPHPDPISAHGQVGALHQRIAERRGEHRVLKGGLVQRPWSEDDDPRIFDRAGRDLLKCGAQRAEEGRQAVHLRLTMKARQHARDHGAVLKRVTGAGRRLAAVGERHDVAALIAADVDRVEEQLLRSRQPHAVTGAQEARVPVDQLRRQQTAAQELTRPVDVLENEAEQLRPLNHAALNVLPLPAREHGRQRIEAPGTSWHRRFAVGVVDDTVLFEQARRLVTAALQLARTEFGANRGQALPMGTRLPLGVEHLVVTARERLVRRCRSRKSAGQGRLPCPNPWFRTLVTGGVSGREYGGTHRRDVSSRSRSSPACARAPRSDPRGAPQLRRR